MSAHTAIGELLLSLSANIVAVDGAGPIRRLFGAAPHFNANMHTALPVQPPQLDDFTLAMHVDEEDEVTSNNDGDGKA